MPVINFVLHYILYEDALFKRAAIWLYSFPLLFVMGAASWRMQVAIQKRVQHRYPSLKQSRTRILLLALGLIPFMSASVTLIFFTYDYFSILQYHVKPYDVEYGLLVGLCMNLIFVTLYEVEYVLERFKESFAEKESVRQQSLQHEFDVLKNQVNPHFFLIASIPYRHLSRKIKPGPKFF